MKISKDNIMVVRYLRALGLQQIEIANYLGITRQAVAYQLSKVRSATIEKGELPGLKQAGSISPLVGYVSAPCPPELKCDWGGIMCDSAYGEANHSCPIYVQHAAYAQIEDLPKHQKIAVLLALLQEVEAE